jgi:hypothetical protein
MLKRCFKCGIEKPLSEFYRQPGMADGHLGKCKECAKSDVRAGRRGNRDRLRDYERKRAVRPERKRQAAESLRRHRLRFPEKNAARQAVSRGLRSGKISRKPCEVCGSIRVQSHHDDYSKPLAVKWLCFKHHREREHGQTVAFPF